MALHPQQYMSPTPARITPASPALPISTPSSPVGDSRTSSHHQLLSSSSSSAAGPSRPPILNPVPLVSHAPPYWSTNEWHNTYDAEAPSTSSARHAVHSILDEKPSAKVDTVSSPTSDLPLDIKLDPAPQAPAPGLVVDPLRASPGIQPHSSRTTGVPRGRIYPGATSQPLIAHQRHYAHRTRPPSCWKPWLPMMAWGATSIGFLLAIAFWRTQVFQGLDDLSLYLREQGLYGQGILFFLVFLTTFPPLPLYSTLLVLSGYTFGPTIGFYISYSSSLFGAFVVFVIFRHFVPTAVSSSLLPPSLKRVVRAIERRPSIFFLIRVAPYPYNVLNAVLGSSSSMPMSRYLFTTAASLCKVIVHTMVGGEIRSFKDFRTAQPKDTEKDEWDWKEGWTVLGIVLCAVLFVYLSLVARRAVDEADDGLLPSSVVNTSNSTESPVMLGAPHTASSNPFYVSFPPQRRNEGASPSKLSLSSPIEFNRFTTAGLDMKAVSPPDPYQPFRAVSPFTPTRTRVV